MKKTYLRPVTTTVRAGTTYPLAASKPTTFGGELGARYRNKLWDDDEYDLDDDFSF